MSASEAFELLGLPPDADARAIKRAYHKLLKRHKPDSDPDGFRRLRDAFEAASEAEAMQAFAASFEVPHVSQAEEEPQPPRDPKEVPQSEVNPAVVLDALDRDEVQWAYELVMDDRWAAAMLGEDGGHLRWATRCVGLRVLLLNRPAFGLLASKYPDAFDHDDTEFVYLLRVSGDWSSLAATLSLPPALVAFATRMPLERDPAVRRELARALGAWFQRDVARGMALMHTIAQQTSDVRPFLRELASEFEAELDSQATGDPPANCLRALTWPATSLAIVALLALLFVRGVGDDPVWGVLRLLGFSGGGVLGFIWGEGAVYEALPSLRRRFLLACIEAGLEPSLAAVELNPHIYLRQAIQQDAGMELAFHVGRLGKLRGDA